MRTAVLLLCGLALAWPATSEAQRPERPLSQRPRQGPPGRGPDSGNGRARLESEVRRNFTRLVRERVGLSDQQMGRLGAVTQKYEQQRRQIQMDERGARMGLQLAMRNESGTDTARVNQFLQTLIDVHKRRAALLESEQRELAEFMTPLQRARFMALQEQMRRNLEQMRQRRVP